MGCDTFVALAPATAAGATLFMKNSDRPADEAQRLVQLPRRRTTAGTRVRCQTLEIPDVDEAAAVVGSQPWWLWGFEHGVNEHRVAIGNETVFTKEALPEIGLLGMDLVRLGLERSRTATEALEVMTALIETHGQGGSGQRKVHFPYNNSFIVADPSGAWTLETSGRHWVAKPATDVANISNGLAIGRDWTRGAADVTAFAVREGWWPPAAGPVDFAAAYNDDASMPPNICGERRRRGSELLARDRGAITAASARALLRDHYESGPVHRPRDVSDPRFLSICMHGEPLDNTAASMVMELPHDPDAIVRGWISVGVPCVGAFLPCYPDAPIPTRLGLAGETPEPESLWWRMYAIHRLVERDFQRFAPIARQRFDALESRFISEADEVESRALRSPARAALLAEFMERSLDTYLTEVARLTEELQTETR